MERLTFKHTFLPSHFGAFEVDLLLADLILCTIQGGPSGPPFFYCGIPFPNKFVSPLQISMYFSLACQMKFIIG